MTSDSKHAHASVPSSSASEPSRDDAGDRFRILVESTLQGVLVHRALRPLFANAAFARMLGYASPGDIVTQESVQRLVFEDDWERMQDYARRRVAGEPVPDRYEYRARHRDGQPLWMLCHVSLIPWEGAPAVLLTVVEDTLRKQAELDLQASRHLLLAVLNTLPHHLFVVNPEGRYLLVNERFKEFWGVDPSQGDASQVLEPWAEQRTRADRLLLSGAIPRLEAIRDVSPSGGEQRTLRTVKSVLRDQEARIIGLVGITEDVTELERSQRALREQQELLAAVFDALPQQIAVKDQNGRYLSANLSFCNHVGLPRSAIVGKRPTDMATQPFQEMLRAAEIDRKILSGALEHSELIQHVRYVLDDVPRAARVVKTPLKDSAGRISGMIAIIENLPLSTEPKGTDPWG